MQLPVGFLPSQPAPTISPTHLPDMPTIALVDTEAHEALGSVAKGKLEEYIGRDQVRLFSCQILHRCFHVPKGQVVMLAEWSLEATQGPRAAGLLQKQLLVLKHHISGEWRTIRT